MTRQRGAPLVLTTPAGAFLASGVSPVVTAPITRADIVEVIIDPVVDSVGGGGAGGAGSISGQPGTDGTQGITPGSGGGTC